MRSEAPFILKALRLVSIVVIVAVVALAASAGYSAYQEYRALSGTLSQGQQGSSNGNNKLLSESFNGTDLILNGITIPNNMSYPLGLQLTGTIQLAQTNVCNFASVPLTIPPGESKALQVVAPVNFSRILANPKALNSLLMQPGNFATNITILASIAPLLVLDISQSSNSTVGPILGQFSVSPQSPNFTSDHQYVILPLQVGWNNSTPLSFSGTLSAVITKMPGKSVGNYGSATSPITMTEGSNQNTLNFKIPVSEFSMITSPHGEYDFNITVSALGTSVSIPESVND
jgi:hypothetical protein